MYTHSFTLGAHAQAKYMCTIFRTGCLVLRLDTSAISFLRSQLIQTAIFQGILKQFWDCCILFRASLFDWLIYWHLGKCCQRWQYTHTHTFICYLFWHSPNYSTEYCVCVCVSQIQRLKSLWMWQVDNVNGIMLNAIYSWSISLRSHIMEIHDFDIDRLATKFPFTFRVLFLFFCCISCIVVIRFNALPDISHRRP